MNVSLWLTYFSLNAVNSRNIPWGLGSDLSPEEAQYIVPSLQEFQIGESSEGNRLRVAAAAWAERHDDQDLPFAIDLFIAEEQRHAAELARFLGLNGHPVLARSAGDSAFRLLRHVTGGLEVSLSVLLIAEIIGFVYYRALRRGTSSALLRAICDTFLLDEASHLVFHTEQLSRMRRTRPRLLLWLARDLSRLLMVGACGIVWSRHRRVLQRGGLTLGSFVAQCLARLGFILGMPHGAPRRAISHRLCARTST